MQVVWGTQHRTGYQTVATKYRIFLDIDWPRWRLLGALAVCAACRCRRRRKLRRERAKMDINDI